MSSGHPLVVTLAGVGSTTGGAKAILGAVITYLQTAGGYRSEDFVEASYKVEGDGAPLFYRPDDTTQPLEESVNRVAQNLHWYRLHTERPIHLLGWSLGGVVLFEALRQLVDEDMTWFQTIRSLVAISSPLLGSDLDGIDLLGELAAGPVGADLARRAADKQQKSDVRAAAERLRRQGIRIVTIASEDDAVVTPADALLPSLGPEPAAIILRPRRRFGASYLESILGHGNLPNDPSCWTHVLRAVGRAE